VESVQELPRDRAMSSRPVYQVHPGWAVDGGLKGVTLCFLLLKDMKDMLTGLHSEECVGCASLPSHVLKASSKAITSE